MSVIVSKRGKQKFGVITKALELAAYTVKICSNEKNFPKKYRWVITKDIVNEALHIVTSIRKANNLDLRHASLRDKRLEYQMEANGSCEALLTLIEVAWDVMPLSDDRVEFWTGLVIAVEEALAVWRESDKKRIADMAAKVVKFPKAS